MSITSFVLGMRLGKKQAELFLHPDSLKNVPALEIKSQHEETTESSPVNEASEAQAFVDTPGTKSENDVDEETFKKLQAEYQKLNAQDMGASETPVATENSVTPAQPQTESATESTSTPEVIEVENKSFLTPDPSFIGKYTIQLGSYRTLDEAKSFADGFLTRGYKPLVREVEVRGQGTWYRVSLGVFESISAATQYIQKESNLFGAFKKDQYFIQEIK